MPKKGERAYCRDVLDKDSDSDLICVEPEFLQISRQGGGGGDDAVQGREFQYLSSSITKGR